MLQTLLVNLKLHFREKAQLFWLFAFPIILATMFNGMFGNIAESYALHTVDVVVVNNDDWRHAETHHRHGSRIYGSCGSSAA